MLFEGHNLFMRFLLLGSLAFLFTLFPGLLTFVLVAGFYFFFSLRASSWFAQLYSHFSITLIRAVDFLLIRYLDLLHLPEILGLHLD